jgi:plasmid stabilization system protein ParE
VSLRLVLRPRAEADLDDAFHWYETCVRGLGETFLRSVDACLSRIQCHPEAHAMAQSRVRRASLHRFPYGVFYVVREDHIDVLAVYHARQRPRAFEP